MANAEPVTLEELFNEARAAQAQQPSRRPRHTTTKALATSGRTYLALDNTLFYMRPAPREQKAERFPLRQRLPGQLSFPAPAREAHRLDGKWWSTPWSIEGVVLAVRGGAFFTDGQHDFECRRAAAIAKSETVAGFHIRDQRVSVDDLTAWALQPPTPLPHPRLSQVDADAFLDQLLAS